MTSNSSDSVQGSTSQSLFEASVPDPDAILEADAIPTIGKLLIIAGSRDVENEVSAVGVELMIENAVDALPFEPAAIISGGADGVDTIAEEWAKEQGLPVARFEPNWSNIDHPDAVVKEGKYGKYDAKAGYRRNKWMAQFARHHADGGALLALPNFPSGGTENMIEYSREILGDDNTYVISVNSIHQRHTKDDLDPVLFQP